MIISFSGNDGSGKTTLINKLKTSLEKESPNSSIEIRHEFDYFLLKYLLRIFSRKESELKNEYLKPVKSRKNFLIGFVWSILVCIDLYIEYFYLWFVSRFFKKIIILDRCIYDFYISWQYLQVSSRLSRYLVKFFPSYDLSYVLYVDPNLAYKRKIKTHSYPISFYKIQTERYLELKKINKKINFVNTSGAIEKSIKEIELNFYDIYFSKNECDDENFDLFNKFVSLKYSGEWFDEISLKRYKEPIGIKSLLEKNSYKVIKSYYLAGEVSKNEVDVYTSESKNELKRKLNQRKIEYHEEPDRIGFDFQKTEIDLHIGISFWNYKFINEKDLKSSGIYFENNIEYLIYSIHSVYKHGKISTNDLIPSIWILARQKIFIDKFVDSKEWKSGFYFYNNQIRKKIINNELKSSWVPYINYFAFWMILILDDNSISLKQFLIIQYAYMRDRYKLFRKLSANILNSNFGNIFKKKLGYKYIN